MATPDKKEKNVGATTCCLMALILLVYCMMVSNFKQLMMKETNIVGFSW
jgi:hypothetical protein